jgi:hypothetical protein
MQILQTLMKRKTSLGLASSVGSLIPIRVSALESTGDVGLTMIFSRDSLFALLLQRMRD